MQQKDLANEIEPEWGAAMHQERHIYAAERSGQRD